MIDELLRAGRRAIAAGCHGSRFDRELRPFGEWRRSASFSTAFEGAKPEACQVKQSGFFGPKRLASAGHKWPCLHAQKPPTGTPSGTDAQGRARMYL